MPAASHASATRRLDGEEAHVRHRVVVGLDAQTASPVGQAAIASLAVAASRSHRPSVRYASSWADWKRIFEAT